MTPGTRMYFPLTMVLGCLAVGACSLSGLNKHSDDSAAAIRMADYVKVGGIEQWVTITGTDRRNPVILYLHGGPGNAASPFAASLFSGWEKDFTLVQWDQRGAGRTYGKNGKSIESTMTLERMTEDGIEVAEFLRERLHKKKIILVGGSWGAALGIRMAHARPGLFYAYLGLAQLTNWQQATAADYVRLREIAQSKGDQTTLDAFSAIGPPPWDSLEKWLSFRKVQQVYQAEVTTTPDAPIVVAGEYEADFKNGVWQGAENFSFRYFWGPSLSGPLTRLDLTSLTDFKIPIYFIHGEVDLTCPPELTRAYFKTIRAPRKKFYPVPGTGHNPSSAQLTLAREVLLTEVRPIARR